jgi:hypothetical protein
MYFSPKLYNTGHEIQRRLARVRIAQHITNARQTILSAFMSLNSETGRVYCAQYKAWLIAPIYVDLSRSYVRAIATPCYQLCW